MPLDMATALATQKQLVRPGAQVVRGWVVSHTATTVTVTLADSEEQITAPKLRSYTNPVTDDLVVLLNDGGALLCMGTLNEAPAPKPPPDDNDQPPPPKPTTRTKTFSPVYTGYYKGGRWNNVRLRQGNLGNGMRWGAAYYGNGPGSLSGDAVSGKIRVRRVSEGRDGYSVRPTFRLLTASKRPGGFPAYTKTMRGPSLKLGEDATVSLPTSWVQAMIRRQAGGIGIGIDSATPHLALLGKDGWAQAFQLTIKWRS